MERGNSTHGSREDDALKEELEGTLRGNRSSRSEEWRDPEPPAEGAEGASLLDRKAKNFPSRDQRGDVSFLSLVNVICLVEASPSLTDTR